MSSNAEFDVGTAVEFHSARDPINLPTIRRWCDAMGDTNPVHTDASVAQRSRHGRVIAPLAMLDVWTKPGQAYRRGTADPLGAAFARLDEEGFTAAVAVSTELTQHRPCSLGEVLTSTITLEGVSPTKTTGLGPGRFVTTVQEFRSEDESVGSSRFSVLKYRPGAGDQRTRPAVVDPPNTAVDIPIDDQPEPDRDQLGTVFVDQLQSGLALLTVPVPVTTTLIVAGALATSDFFEAHHDRDAAQQRGTADVFMNIHTTIGLLTARIGNWLGPNVVWRSAQIRLGVPNYPYDTMIIEPRVFQVEPTTGVAKLHVTATNRLGLHAEGTMTMNLPRR